MNLDNERPLLLNPCQDRPEEYFEFILEGVTSPSSYLMQECSGSIGKKLKRRRAEESIRVYALNRSGLIYDRWEVLRLIEQRKFCITVLMEIMADPQLHHHLLSLVETLIDHEIRNLRDFMDPRRPFSQMARQIIEKFFFIIDPNNAITQTDM
jgi:hypothetical protein